MRTIWSTLWLRTGSVRAQMAKETNLCTKESSAVRTRNGSGSGWCGSTFSKFSSLLSCCVPSFFIDFRSTFDNFKPLASVLTQIFHTNMSGKDFRFSRQLRSKTKRFHGNHSVCLWSTFSGLLRIACPEIISRKAVSSGGGNLSCRQDRSNKTVIATLTHKNT